MDKRLIDRVWSILPREFKEEAKKLYKEFYNEKPHSDCSYGYLGLLIKLFGIHNLTSDAEEEVMLTVPRKIVQDFFMNFKREKNDAKSIFDKISLGARMSMLQDLFGFKCLPDEEQIAENANCSNVDSLSQNPPENCNSENHISTDDSKPAEPTDFGREVNFPTKNNPTIYLKKSKNCDNRLQIAAMAMQGILSCDLCQSPDTLAKSALLYADALLAECEKKGGQDA